jgi:FixJ family two-component response regulator
VALLQRVLVVDDEQYYRDTIRDALALEGIACDVAAGPGEVQKAVEDPRIACVVLDVKLAVPDALGLLETMLEQRPALRVIALATQDDQDLVLAALQRGACDYLAKPIHDEELCLAVARAFRAHAIESHGASLRERVRRLAEHGDALERAARAGVAPEALARARGRGCGRGGRRGARGRCCGGPRARASAVAARGRAVRARDDAELRGRSRSRAARAGFVRERRRGQGAFGDEDEALLRAARAQRRAVARAARARAGAESRARARAAPSSRRRPCRRASSCARSPRA